MAWPLGRQEAQQRNHSIAFVKKTRKVNNIWLGNKTLWQSEVVHDCSLIPRPPVFLPLIFAFHNICSCVLLWMHSEGKNGKGLGRGYTHNSTCDVVLWEIIVQEREHITRHVTLCFQDQHNCVPNNNKPTTCTHYLPLQSCQPKQLNTYTLSSCTIIW